MYFLRAFKVALTSLAANTLRSVLAVLGIVIGVSAVIMMIAMGKGAQVAVTDSITRLGVNLVFVWPNWQGRGSGAARNTQSETLSLEDAEALARLPHIAAVAPEFRRDYQVKYMSQNVSTRVVGTTPSHLAVRNFVIDRGEYFDKAEVLGRARVCVLGSKIARDLFGNVDPLGRQIQVDRKNFEVIGILGEKGGDQWARLDDSVYVPVTTALYRLANRRHLSQITISVDAPENVEAAVERVIVEMDRLHKTPPQEDSDFTVSSMSEMLRGMQEATGAFTLLLAGIALVSLLVGGIGIMNIMLVSVTERTREIGIRKAVGARRSDILKQFLIESTTISLMGGLLGIAIGVAGAQLVPKLPVWQALSRGGEWSSVIAPESIVVSFLFSCAVGIFFGIYPALKAARLSPVEALRYE
jgi:ABC-type antimicrobial peptide transport system permease subunit